MRWTSKSTSEICVAKETLVEEEKQGGSPWSTLADKAREHTYLHVGLKMFPLAVANEVRAEGGWVGGGARIKQIQLTGSRIESAPRKAVLEGSHPRSPLEEHFPWLFRQVAFHDGYDGREEILGVEERLRVALGRLF